MVVFVFLIIHTDTASIKTTGVCEADLLITISPLLFCFTAAGSLGSKHTFSFAILSIPLDCMCKLKYSRVSRTFTRSQISERAWGCSMAGSEVWVWREIFGFQGNFVYRTPPRGPCVTRRRGLRGFKFQSQAFAEKENSFMLHENVNMCEFWSYWA